MKVALVASGFLPGCGALEQRVDRLAEGLVERGADVEILTQTAGGSPSALLTPYGARVRRFPFPGAPRFFLVPAFWDQLRRSAAHADIVDIHTADPSLALAVSARAPRRAVLTPYGPVERFARWPQSRMTRAALARAGLVVCATEVDRQALAGHFPEALPRSTVVPSGADTRELDAARAYSASGPVVLAVGPLRRVQPLARAIAAMAALDPSFTLVVAGHGPARARLAAYASDLQVADRVRFVGHLTRTELHRWLATACVVLTLSEQPGSGSRLREGLASGATVVASDLPVHREIAARTGGSVVFVTPAGSPLDVTDAIVAAAALAARGAPVHRAVASWDATVDATWAVYERLALGGADAAAVIDAEPEAEPEAVSGTAGRVGARA